MRLIARLASAIVALGGLAIALLDLSGLITLPSVVERIPVITLLTIGSLATVVTLDHASRLQHIDNRISANSAAILSALDSPEVIVLPTVLDYWDYCTRRIRSADYMDDLTWGVSGARWRSEKEKRAYQAYRDAIAARCRRSGMHVREIFTFPVPIRFKRMMDVLNAPGTSSYSARYYEMDADGSPPLIQLTIFDKEEVLIGPHRGDQLDVEGERYLLIKNPQIVEVFRDYFEASWLGALRIADGSHREEETIAALHSRFDMELPSQ